MQYQNEKSIRDLVEIVRGNAKTLIAVCDRIEQELDKPTQPNLGGFGVAHSYDWQKVQLTPALRELHQMLKSRNYPVNINTIARELNISLAAARGRLDCLRKAGVNVETVLTGKPLAKYRIA